MPFLFFWNVILSKFLVFSLVSKESLNTLLKDKKGTTKLHQFTSSAESFKFDHYMSFWWPLWPLNSNRWLLLSMQYVLPSLPLTKQSSKQQKKTIKREYKLPIEAYFTGQLISEHFWVFLVRWAKLFAKLFATLCQSKNNKN